MSITTFDKLKQMQAIPLEEKINASIRRIREWHEHWDGDVSVSFSGGKDSTVLLHLVRSIYPDVKAVFASTGNEFPEILDFVHSTQNVQVVRPKMPFREVIAKYGYPVVSKKVSGMLSKLRTAKPGSKNHTLIMTGINSHGQSAPSFKIPEKWKPLINSGIKFSDHCCSILKKQCLDSCGLHPYVGTMASDSKMREKDYLQSGSCNVFDAKTPMSKPLSFWLESDIWEYLKRFSVPYSKIYDMGYHRTGCFACCFGLHLEKRPNRFDLMQKTHPKLYTYVMDTLGFRAAIVAYYPQQFEVNV